MRSTARNYREELYRLRAHPEQDLAGFYDGRDSFLKVYLSVVPFLVLEYLAEISYDVLPGGMVFPVGFLLFWAFYYTYYKPGFLENRLTAPTQTDVWWLPTMIVGILIWFVKVTFVELSHLVFFQWWMSPKAKAASRPQQKASPQAAHTQARRAAPPQLLPPDLIEALHVLGLKPGCTWKEIHKNYRALAKQFHPDLNPEITDFGHRFMRIDSAYHKLEKVRAKHFPN